ncbi:hypothetical protein PAECIP111893_05044 [Paenibacillus plantiphilus]|uniref:Uncharacterized protein n=1 Tax=Paenibacillus plantiphilus TaxID=2905650 RepID=A0ABN8H0I3_9BACL|nr:hypothetical protein PAECIP111893_05044 [Paenibacillus plantiphilus]
MVKGKRSDGLQRIIEKMRIDLRLHGFHLICLIGDFQLIFPHYKIGDCLHHGVESAGENTKLVIPLHLYIDIQIAGLNLIHGADQFFNRICKMIGNIQRRSHNYNKKQGSDDRVNLSDLIRAPVQEGVRLHLDDRPLRII